MSNGVGKVWSAVASSLCNSCTVRRICNVRRLIKLQASGKRETRELRKKYNIINYFLWYRSGVLFPQELFPDQVRKISSCIVLTFKYVVLNTVQYSMTWKDQSSRSQDELVVELHYSRGTFATRCFPAWRVVSDGHFPSLGTFRAEGRARGVLDGIPNKILWGAFQWYIAGIRY